MMCKSKDKSHFRKNSKIANDLYNPNEILDAKLKALASSIECKINASKFELLKWFISVTFLQTIALIISIWVVALQGKI